MTFLQQSATQPFTQNVNTIVSISYHDETASCS